MWRQILSQQWWFPARSVIQVYCGLCIYTTQWRPLTSTCLPLSLCKPLSSTAVHIARITACLFSCPGRANPSFVLNLVATTDPQFVSPTYWYRYCAVKWFCRWCVYGELVLVWAPDQLCNCFWLVLEVSIWFFQGHSINLKLLKHFFQTLEFYWLSFFLFFFFFLSVPHICPLLLNCFPQTERLQ